MSLGAGYTYLIESVARNDAATRSGSALTRYYAESGTPPGRFLGNGLAGLDRGAGVAPGSEVSDQMLFRMLGMMADPITGEPLGRAPRRWPEPLQRRIRDRVGQIDGDLSDGGRAARIQAIEADEAKRDKRLARPVAGFDLTFSVPKSVSAAWALADTETREVIYQAHLDAIADVISYAEREVFFSRSGTNGVVQEDIRGVVATLFDHWDSRAGDPHLHTHVVILNRVQTADGTWRTLDSRGLFKQVVALSEMHEGVLSDLLTHRLGWAWDERARRHSSVPRHEVVGVSDALIAEYSQRSHQIESAKNDVVTAFSDKYGRQPTSAQVLGMRQRATLSTRPDKQHRSLRQLGQEWRHRAAPHVGVDPVQWVQTLRGRTDLPALRADDLTDSILIDAASAAVRIVSDRRATFTRANILAEVHRQLHGVRFATPKDRIAVADHTTQLALQRAVVLTPPEIHHVPAVLRRADGTSRFRGRGTEVYTTIELIDAERRLMDAANQLSGPTVAAAAIADIASRKISGTNRVLAVDQAAAIAMIATSGRALDLLVGPAGTGKTTTLAGLKQTWEYHHGLGSVIGLAPSAAAADVLATEIGIGADNTAKWLTETGRQPERVAQIDALRARLAEFGSPGSVAARTIAARIDDLERERARWAIGTNQLVILDEASLAGTHTLDQIVQHAIIGGGKVVLVGDWAQLSAVDAGGAFKLLVAGRDVVPELSDVRRFANDWEKTASVQLRTGDTRAIESYLEHERLREGDREQMLDAIYRAWRHDTDHGLNSLMIAPDRENVAHLNQRARQGRIQTGEVAPGSVEIASSGIAGVGDVVVTRHNDRRLTVGQGWVKNGDRWTVQAIAADGSMTVRRAEASGQVTLAAEYVREHVDLGYATTAFRSQGRTVDTAHTLVNQSTTREVLYVSATRGRLSNTIYVDTLTDPDVETRHGPDADGSSAAVLATVLGNVGSDISAHAMVKRERDRVGSLHRLRAEYQTIASVARTSTDDHDIQRTLDDRARTFNRRSRSYQRGELENGIALEAAIPTGPS